MQMQTKRDIPMQLWGSAFTVPKGTRLNLIPNASGNRGALYAVASVALLMQLSGNKHDPVYRYAFVELDDAEPLPATPEPINGEA